MTHIGSHKRIYDVVDLEKKKLRYIRDLGMMKVEVSVTPEGSLDYTSKMMLSSLSDILADIQMRLYNVEESAAKMEELMQILELEMGSSLDSGSIIGTNSTEKES